MKTKLQSFFDELSTHKILCVIFMLNIIDAWLTLTWIKIGIAHEANPLMAHLLMLGDQWFICIKVFAVAIACVCLYTLRNHELAIRVLNLRDDNVITLLWTGTSRVQPIINFMYFA